MDRFPQLKLVIAHFGGGIAAVKDCLLAKGYRFDTLKRSFADYFEMLYFDLAGFEGGLPASHCALQGIRAERLVFASDYPQDFTGVNTDTGKGMRIKKLHRYDPEVAPRRGSQGRDLRQYGDRLAKSLEFCC